MEEASTSSVDSRISAALDKIGSLEWQAIKEHLEREEMDVRLT